MKFKIKNIVKDMLNESTSYMCEHTKGTPFKKGAVEVSYCGGYKEKILTGHQGHQRIITTFPPSLIVTGEVVDNSKNLDIENPLIQIEVRKLFRRYFSGPNLKYVTSNIKDEFIKNIEYLLSLQSQVNCFKKKGFLYLQPDYNNLINSLEGHSKYV